MKCIVLLLAVVGFAVCDEKKFVFDLLKPPLTAAEVENVLVNRAIEYPTYATIPDTKFSCASKKQPGFYADQEAQCQVFHRCTQGGGVQSFLCTNRTIFNQITLTCDDFWNVDCAKSQQFEDFANSRLYQNKLPLFDTPPEKWIAQTGAVQSSEQVVPQSQKRTGPVTAGGSASISAGSSSSSEESIKQ